MTARATNLCGRGLRMHAPSVTKIGRYEVLAQLGRGAMGVVYQARDPQIDRLVAIKTILWLGEEEEAQNYLKRFLQEAKAAGRLSHPGIVQVFDVGTDPESTAPFIVMEYVAGQSLNKLLAAAPGTKLPSDTALRLTEEIAEALSYAHSQGVVHRDIKPANILVTEDGRAKIADFGVAKLDFSNLTIAGHAVGTPAYMAPEQLAGGLVDGRADIFSLGVILYSMLCGFRPFQGRGNSTIAHKVQHGEPLPVSMLDVHLPPEIDALIARAMAKDPADRFQSGFEMAAAIRALRGAETPASGSSDAWAVIQETRSHVACMDPEKGSSQKNPAAAQNPAGPSASKPAQPAAVAAAVASVKAEPAPKPPVPVATARKQVSGSKRALAMTLGVSLLAACTLAWRLHASMQPAAAPAPVSWEQSEPTVTATQAAEPIADTSTSTAETLVTSASEPPARIEKKLTKSRATDQDADTVDDRTVRLVPVAAKSASTRVTTSKPAAASKQSAAASKQPAAAADSATLNIAIDHAFDEAHLTVWVGDRQVLTDTLHAEKKRLLMFQRTHGNFVEKVSVPAGQHLVRVRLQSAPDAFDASQSVNGDFTKASNYVLNAHCDKKKKELRLDLGPVTVASAAP